MYNAYKKTDLTDCSSKFCIKKNYIIDPLKKTTIQTYTSSSGPSNRISLYIQLKVFLRFNSIDANFPYKASRRRSLFRKNDRIPKINIELQSLYRHDDKYNLILVLRDTNGKFREASINKSFANFIDTNGTVVQNLVLNEVNKMYNSLSSEKKEK